MFNILMISPSFYPATYYGGPIYSSYELAKALKKDGSDIKVITTNANGKEKLKIKTGVFHFLDKELPVKYYDSLDSRGTSLSLLLNLWKEIRNTDLVYLISIFSPPTPFTIILCKLFKKPIIITPQGQFGEWCLYHGNRFKKLWLHTFIQPYIKHLHWHLTSESEQQDVLVVYPSAKTFIIPNGVGSEVFSMKEIKKDRSSFNRYYTTDSTVKHVIISMGRFQKVKGFDILIKAFDILVKQKPDCLLFIAGEDFGEKSELQKLINTKNLGEQIILLGYIEGEEKINFLKNADVFALPSHHENFGMVYAESLAAGTPIVASTKTPWQDVENQSCGKWVENTPDKFAEAILVILNSDSIQMGLNGRKYVKENFSWDKIALDFRIQIEKIISV